MSSEIYKEIILDNYRNPRNFGDLEDPDIEHKDYNPLCGDELRFQIKLDEDQRVSEVRFTGQGCAISQASASMLTERIQDMTLDEIRALEKKDILDMLGINVSPTRLKCALLPLKVVKLGVYEYLGAHNKDPGKD
ncbi:MAG: Fe-S cluster assembly sulfur transfer protein SufU [Candidatus Geothermarchaeales archaeon]